MRFAVWLCVCMVGSLTPTFSFAQRLSQPSLSQPPQNCEERLSVLQEEYAILQDQHAVITIPRAEADQRMLIKLRRDLEWAQQRLKVLEAESTTKEKVSAP